MKKKNFRNETAISRRVGAFLTTGALLVSSFAASLSAQNMNAAAVEPAGKLSEDQRVVHVLNRLGFGARPGEVERVKAMGGDKYIELQLHPEKIDDSVSEAKLQNLETLRMSTAELYEKYPQPGQLLIQLQRRGARR